MKSALFWTNVQRRNGPVFKKLLVSYSPVFKVTNSGPYCFLACTSIHFPTTLKQIKELKILPHSLTVNMLIEVDWHFFFIWIYFEAYVFCCIVQEKADRVRCPGAGRMLGGRLNMCTGNNGVMLDCALQTGSELNYFKMK